MSTDADLKNAWRSQPTPSLQGLPTEQLLAQIDAGRALIQRRNRREMIAAALTIPVFCFYIWLFPMWLSQLGSACVVAGSLWVIWQLHRRASSLPLPEELAAQGLSYQRAQMQRQHDALQSVWRWYLAPLAPGMLLFSAGLHSDEMGWVPMLLADGLMLMVFGWIHWRNRRAAAQLRTEIEALNRWASGQ